MKKIRKTTFCLWVMFTESMSSEFIIFRVGTSSQPSSNSCGTSSFKVPFPTNSSTEKEAISQSKRSDDGHANRQKLPDKELGLISVLTSQVTQKNKASYRTIRWKIQGSLNRQCQRCNSNFSSIFYWIWNFQSLYISNKKE